MIPLYGLKQFIRCTYYGTLLNTQRRQVYEEVRQFARDADELLGKERIVFDKTRRQSEYLQKLSFLQLGPTDNVQKICY